MYRWLLLTALVGVLLAHALSPMVGQPLPPIPPPPPRTVTATSTPITIRLPTTTPAPIPAPHTGVYIPLLMGRDDGG